MSRKACIKNTEDATACYDRIIPGVWNLASRSHGMHRYIALVQGETLAEASYHVKTTMGLVMLTINIASCTQSMARDRVAAIHLQCGLLSALFCFNAMKTNHTVQPSKAPTRKCRCDCFGRVSLTTQQATSIKSARTNPQHQKK